MHSAEHLPSGLSLLLVYGLLTPSLLYLLGRALAGTLVNLRRALAANRRLHTDAPLAPGPAVVRGSLRRGDDGAVRIDVEQSVARTIPPLPKQPGSGRYEWSETARHRTARPFVLTLDSGASLHVEPGQRRTLLAELGPPGTPFGELGDRRRTRTAQLRSDQAIVIAGELVAAGEPIGGGYREAPERALVMRPPAAGPMVLASDSLGRRYLQRARFWAAWTLAALLAAAVAHGGLLSGYHLRVWRGAAVSATVTELQYWAPNGPKSATFIVHGITAGGEIVRDALAGRSFGGLTQGAQTPFVVVPGHRVRAQIGLRPEAPLLAVLILLAGTVVLLFAFHRTIVTSRPWYHPRPVVDREPLVPPGGAPPAKLQDP
jgi:hypothetical protein